MSRIFLELSVAIGLTLAAILASATGAAANELSVSSAFARASATPVAKSAVAYVSIRNAGSQADRLIAISTPSARSAELHTTIMAGGIMKMEPAGVVELPAGSQLEMQPGGLHIMIMGLAAPLKQGESIEMTLGFEKAGDMKVTVPIGSVAATSP